MPALLVRLLGMRAEPWGRIGQRGGVRGAATPRSFDSVEQLRDTWADRTLRAGWPAKVDEWRCVEVDAVCACLIASGASGPELPRASRLLGEQRAAAGVGLATARADLGALLGLAQVRRRRRLELVEALTVGWVEHAVDRVSALPIVDADADMATSAYLELRLDELYREASIVGSDVSDTHLLVVVETSYTAHRLVAEARLAALHSALRYAFVGGESIVRVSSRRALVLAARDEPRLTDSLLRLRSELKIALAEGRLPGVHSWRLALPSGAADLALTMIEVSC